MTGKNTFCTKSDQIGTFHQSAGNPKMSFQCSRIPYTETCLGILKNPLKMSLQFHSKKGKVTKKSEKIITFIFFGSWPMLPQTSYPSSHHEEGQIKHWLFQGRTLNHSSLEVHGTSPPTNPDTPSPRDHLPKHATMCLLNTYKWLRSLENPTFSICFTKKTPGFYINTQKLK